MSLRRILLIPRAFQAFRPITVNALHLNLGTSSKFTKLILTQSRCLYTKKSLKDHETEEEAKKEQSGLYKINYLPKDNSAGTYALSKPFQTYTSLTDVLEKIQRGPLDYKSIRAHLFGMMNLFKMHRSSPDFAAESDSFIKSEEFERLAQSLEKSLPMASTKYLHLIFEVMHCYRIPHSSILMQKLHALILDNINDFELTEVIKMYLIIRESNEKLLEPLQKAFLAYMDHLTCDNLKFLGNIRNITYFAAKEEVPFSVREKIFRKVLSLEFRLKELDPLMLMWLSFSLRSPEFQALEKTHLLNALKETIPTNFQYKHLKVVLESLSLGIRKKIIYYDSKLFDLIAERAKEYSLWAASDIMSNLISIGHLNYALADVLADKCIKCDLKSENQRRVERLMRNFAEISYRYYLKKNDPLKWQSLKKVLLEYLESGVEIESLRASLCAFILNIDSKELASKVLNQFCKRIESSKKVSTTSVQLAYLLYQYHCAVYSSPPENLPESFVPDCLSKLKDLLLNEWKESLCETVDGEEYVLERCKTPLGTLISYVVVLGPDKNPINLSSYKKPAQEGSVSVDDFIDMEKIERPPDSKVYAFIEHGKRPIKFRNNKTLRMESLITITLHKNLGYRVVYLFQNSYKNSVNDRRKILVNVLSPELTDFAESETTESTINN